MKRITVNLLGALVAGSALVLEPSSAPAQVMVFTNPAPAANDRFGGPVTAVGTDRVLIGSPGHKTGLTNVGAAYLFNTNGTLLATFLNPAPSYNTSFGESVAAVGTDRMLISLPTRQVAGNPAGVVDVFSTNGVLLLTITNPSPTRSANNFGAAMATVGTDRVLIGATGNYTGATESGAAYLFAIDGTLLTTFTNPAPAAYDNFGYSVATLGTDRVLIGAAFKYFTFWPVGAVYLFSTNGTLLATIPNPSAGESGSDTMFGSTVAGVGTDSVLIGAAGVDIGIEFADVGAAYLFSTNGTLLFTFTSPAPAFGEGFGTHVAAMGADRVLIGAPSANVGAASAGTVYLFSTDGELLATLTQPTPAEYEYFGSSFAVVGTHQVLIGTPWDDDAVGAAYLLNAVAPTSGVPALTLALTTTNTLALSWPSSSTGWALQENTNGLASANWSIAPGTIEDDGTTKTLVITPQKGNRFYRLFKP
jgi:hypothetical protein